MAVAVVVVGDCFSHMVVIAMLNVGNLEDVSRCKLNLGRKCEIINKIKL